ncbi:MAG: hypothetical protein ACLQPH_19645 [Acidimicrobiales bacterium]
MGRTSDDGDAPADDTRVRPLGLLLTIVIAAALVIGIGAFFWSQTYTSPSGTEVAQTVGLAVVNGVAIPHVTLRFQTYPDSTGSVNGVPIHPSGNPSWPAYGLTNEFQVPAHALVTVTVRQYDSGGSLNNPWFASVRGTVGGVALVNGKRVSSIDPNNVGHTFTIRGTPGTDPGFFVNVPLMAVGGNNQADNGQYNTIVFSFVSGSAGVYAWNCEYPCGSMVQGFGGTMGAYGYMSGFMHVV